MIRKRMSALLLILAMIISVLPLSAIVSFADEYTFTYGTNIGEQAKLKCNYLNSEKQRVWADAGSVPMSDMSSFMMVYVSDYDPDGYQFEGWEINGKMYEQDIPADSQYPDFPDGEARMGVCVDYTDPSLITFLQYMKQIPEEERSRIRHYAYIRCLTYGTPAAEWHPRDLDIKAHFVKKVPSYELNVSAVPEAGGVVTAKLVRKTTAADIWRLSTPGPNAGYSFKGWREKGTEDIISTDLEWEVGVSKDSEFEAVFEQAQYEVFFEATPEAAGTVTGSFTEKQGTDDIWRLEASEPNEGYKFDGWRLKDTTDILCEERTYSVSVSQTGLHFEAVYSPVEYKIDVDSAKIYTGLPIKDLYIENSKAGIYLHNTKIDGYKYNAYSFFESGEPGSIRVYKGDDTSGEQISLDGSGVSTYFIMPLSDSITVEYSYRSGESTRSFTKTFSGLKTLPFEGGAPVASYMSMPFARGAQSGPVFKNMGPDFSEEIAAFQDPESGEISMFSAAPSASSIRTGALMVYTGGAGEHDWEPLMLEEGSDYLYNDYPAVMYVDGCSADSIVVYTDKYYKGHTLFFMRNGKLEPDGNILSSIGNSTVNAMAAYSQSDIYFYINDNGKGYISHYDGEKLEKIADCPMSYAPAFVKLYRLDDDTLLFSCTGAVYKLSRKTNTFTPVELKGDAAGEERLRICSIDLYNGPGPRGIIEKAHWDYDMSEAYEWDIATGETRRIDLSAFSNDGINGITPLPYPVEVAYACDGNIYAVAGSKTLAGGSGLTDQTYIFRYSDGEWIPCSVGNKVTEPQPDSIKFGPALDNPCGFTDIINPVKGLTLFVGHHGTAYSMGDALFGGLGGVIKMLNELPEPEAVELSHRAQIEKAQKAFSSLTDEQKAKVDPALTEKLEKDVARLQELINAQPQDPGHVYVTTENLTFASSDNGWEKGFILPPTVVDLIPGDTPATVITRVLKENNIQTSQHSSYGFYVEGIRSPLDTGKMLCEFSGGPQSGWMYMVNNSFPSVGAGGYGLMQDGDVMRWQYTASGLGADIGGGVSGGTGAFGNKDTLISAIALVNSLGEQGKYGDDYTKAMSVLTKLGASQDEINEALIPFAGLVPINDHAAVEALIDKIPSPVTLESKAATEAARKAYNGLSNAEKAKVVNYDKLLEAEAALAVLTVEQMIQALPEPSSLTEADSGAVAAAKDAFDALTGEQQAKISGELSVKLKKALKRIAELSEALAGRFGDIYKSTAAKIVSFGELQFGSEWMALGLSRSGYGVPDGYFKKYLDNVAATLKERDGNLLGKSGKKYTEYERTILALTSAGVDVRSVAGYNLLNRLTDYDKVTWQGLNAADFALIALDSHNYEIPEVESGGSQLTRGKLIDNVLAAEISGEDGYGWAYSGNRADPDMTAMTVQALTPYYLDEKKFNDAGSTRTYDELKAAVERGIAVLSAIQKSDGGYDSWGSINSESCAQVLVALTGLGIDPVKDPRFTKSTGNPLTALLSFYVEGGGFKHVASGELNGMATEQAYYAMAAYSRFKAGKTSLYNMTDIELKPYMYSPAPHVNPSVDSPQTNQSETAVHSTPAADTQSTPSSPAASAAGTAAKTKSKDKPKDEAVRKAIEAIKALTAPEDKAKALPDDFLKLGAEQEKAIIEAYRLYQQLTAEQKKQVDNYNDLKTLLEKLGAKYHYDETSKLDMRDNDEKSLPWHIRLKVTVVTETGATFAKMKELVGSDKKVLSLFDIAFEDVLTGGEWHPDEPLTLKLPVPDTGEYDSVAVCHMNDEGEINYIDARVTDGELVFESASFSIYSVVAYNGGWETLAGVVGAAGEPDADTVRMWAAVAIIAVLILLAAIYAARKKRGYEQQAK